MITADADGVPERNLLGAIGKDIRNNAHRGFGWIDIGAAGGILLQDIVLDGPPEFFGVRPLFFRHHDIHGQQHRRRRIDGHGGADLFKGNFLEQGFHVRQGVDGHAHLSHFPDGHFMVRIITDLSGEIKGYGKSRLPLVQQKAVSFIGLLGRGEPRILPHGPEASPVHVRLNAPGIGVFARESQVRQIIFFHMVQGKKKKKKKKKKKTNNQKKTEPHNKKKKKKKNKRRNRKRHRRAIENKKIDKAMKEVQGQW
eukprot:TRINITY_DN37681_c0_g1_i1.p2 TRINITY_DN37681_c0_g1~~TRINITY_DN37681_c0_g1_i1.p2  ORF type:complete len:254 (+),score=34.53 TRINITY_DN37681_c0_g1_i1:23-784(+)